MRLRFPLTLKNFVLHHTLGVVIGMKAKAPIAAGWLLPGLESVQARAGTLLEFHYLTGFRLGVARKAKDGGKRRSLTGCSPRNEA